MKITYKYILTISLIILSCTNPFSVREAEPPDISNNSDTYEEPFRSESVLSNLKYALIQKNITNYEKCFVSVNSATSFTYNFLHDQRIEGSLLSDWTLTDEIQYFGNIINSDTLKSIEINFTNNLSHQQITTHPDSVWTGLDYDLSLIFNESFFNYKGQAIFKLVKNKDGIWSIYYWEDRPATDNYENSWSILKLKFR